MRNKLISILVSLVMVLSFFSVSAAASEIDFSDMPAAGSWSHNAMASAVENGLLQGDNGRLMPQDSLTRAQLAAILNRAFGAKDTADISGYTDVKVSSWYCADIAKAVRMSTLQGYNGAIRPDDTVTRQEAFSVLARAIKLADADTAVLDVFTDKAAISAWAAPSLAAMVEAGYVNGSSGRVNPAAAISREQFAQVMYNIFSIYISKAGIYTDNIDGNVLIRSDGVKLSGLTVRGDLVIGEGVGNGDITLDGVTVTGRLVVRAGGENSIRIINSSNVGSIIVSKTGDGGVRVRTEEGCRVDVVYVDDGLDDIILEGHFNQVTVNTNAPVVMMDAVVTGLTVSGKGADVRLEGSSTVSVTQITEGAEGAKLEVGSGSSVAKLESAGDGITISGKGTVTQAVVTGNNNTVNTAGTVVTSADGTTTVTPNPGTTQPGTSSDDPPGEEDNTYTAAVTTLAELQTAISNADATAVIIRGEIVIPEGTTVTFTKPVTIADIPGSILIIDGNLVNNSTFVSRGLGGIFEDTGLELAGSFVNNGTFTNEARFGMFQAEFTNNGTVNNKEWLHCGGCTITNNGAFSSMGDISLLNSNSFDEDSSVPSSFTNAAGATLVIEGPGGVLTRKTCSFTNAGTVTCYSFFENYGTLANTGTFTYSDFLLNAGTISGTLTPNGEKAAIENDRPVETLDEFQEQLVSLDAGYDRIAIVGDISLTENLTIDVNVRILPDGRLEVPAGKTLTITSNSGYNELNVAGKFEVYGSLITTRDGEGENEKVGQVTLTGGVLRGYNGCAITNNGMILVLSGDVMLENEGNFTGNDIIYPARTPGVSTEAELISAMENPEVEEISILEDITLTSDLNITKHTTVTYDDMASTPRTLTIPSGVAVTVKDGGHLSIQGNIVNYGSITVEPSSNNIFMGSYGRFANESTGILTVDNRFDIFEGTFENSGTVSINGGHEQTILVRGGIVTNSGTFSNEGALDMGSSDGNEGAVFNRGTTFTNTADGIFNNGAISTPASNAYFGMMYSTFVNNGDFVNNGKMDINYTSFTHSDGTFTTYNSRSLTITGGSLNTENAAAGTFTNEGYMTVVDEYGRDGENHICGINLGSGTFVNGSGWMDYTASVWSAGGLTAAENAQMVKKSASPEDVDGFFDIYSRLDFKADIAIVGSVSLSAFSTYWVESVWSWDGSKDIETPVTLAVTTGASLTVEQTCGLRIGSGKLINDGTITTAVPIDEGENHKDGGHVEVWSSGTFTNNGVIVNGGEILIHHEYSDADESILRADVTGLDSVAAKFIAEVHNETDLVEANNCSSPVYDRLEIKGDSIIRLTGIDTLTVDKNVYIEPGSGLIVEHGCTLEFKGNGSWIHNNGDISVYGNMTIGSGVLFFNNQKVEIGAVSGSEAASVTVSSGGHFQNDGNVTIYTTGTLDASAGEYNGYAPSGAGTFIAP